MAVFNHVYDTMEVRRVAKIIQGVAANVNQLGSGDVRRIKAALEGNFEGTAANVLFGKLTELENCIKATAEAIETISSTLNDYAKKLEDLDRETAALIRKS